MRTLQQQIAQMQQLFSKKPQNPKNRCVCTTKELSQTEKIVATRNIFYLNSTG
jgi:hypothetical protein